MRITIPSRANTAAPGAAGDRSAADDQPDATGVGAMNLGSAGSRPSLDAAAASLPLSPWTVYLRERWVADHGGTTPGSRIERSPLPSESGAPATSSSGVRPPSTTGMSRADLPARREGEGR